VGGATLIGLALVLVGGTLGAPGLLLVGGLTLLSRWLITIWSRYGLWNVTVDRRIGTDRAVWGDEIELDIEVWNGKLLPLPLLTVDDHVTDTLRVVGRTLGPSDRPGRATLSNGWSLLWFEAVVRHLRIDARRRGVFSFGPMRLTVSDLFERGTRSEQREATAQLIVRPRSVPVRAATGRRAPLGTTRARSSLWTDPARYAGVRAYQPGDPMRRIHWRAAARTGAIVSKRYEPVHDHQVLLALDIQTVPGAHWLMLFDDDQVESLCVGAASLARDVVRDAGACGLVVGAQLAGGGQWAYLGPSTSPGQLGRIDDLLARVQPIATLPFERLLAAVPRRLPPGGTIVTLSARDPTPFLEPMRRLSRTGYGITHLAFGDDAAAHAAVARAAGLVAGTAELAPSWRDADALVLAA
jgi:uncharacterized protein (DUF58 family)